MFSQSFFRLAFCYFVVYFCIYSCSLVCIALLMSLRASFRSFHRVVWKREPLRQVLLLIWQQSQPVCRNNDVCCSLTRKQWRKDSRSGELFKKVEAVAWQIVGLGSMMSVIESRHRIGDISDGRGCRQNQKGCAERARRKRPFLLLLQALDAGLN